MVKSPFSNCSGVTHILLFGPSKHTGVFEKVKMGEDGVLLNSY